MFIIYILFPFIGFLFNLKLAKRIVNFGYLNIAFWFGYSVFFTEGDVTYYRDDFSKVRKFEFAQYQQIILNLYDDNKKFREIQSNLFFEKPDAFAITLSFLVSRITDDSRVFFGILSVIYFYFFLKLLEQVRKLTKNSKTTNSNIYYIFIIFIVPFYVGVTGVRFWPALFFFLWMLFSYVNTKKNIYILLLFISALIHYTFILPSLISLLVLIVKPKQWILIAVTIIGFLYAILASSTSVVSFVSDAIVLLDNETITTNTSVYMSEDYLDDKKIDLNTMNWYIRYQSQIMSIFFFGLYFISFFTKQKTKAKNELLDGLTTIFFLVAALLLNTGSLARFSYIFYILVLIKHILIHLEHKTKRLTALSTVSVILLIYHVLISFRAGFYFVDPYLLFFPSPFLLFVHGETSLSQLIVGH